MEDVNNYITYNYMYDFDYDILSSIIDSAITKTITENKIQSQEIIEKQEIIIESLTVQLEFYSQFSETIIGLFSIVIVSLFVYFVLNYAYNLILTSFC